jgi:hypothetical protein
MDNDERDKMEKDIKKLRVKQKREDKRKDNNISSIPIDVVCDTTTGQSDVLIPTEVITSTDTNTNLPMDVVCANVNVAQSVAELFARTTNIIVNVPSSTPTADITVPSPASTMIYLPMDVVCRSDTDTHFVADVSATTTNVGVILSSSISPSQTVAPAVISSNRTSPASTRTSCSSNVPQSTTAYQKLKATMTPDEWRSHRHKLNEYKREWRKRKRQEMSCNENVTVAVTDVLFPAELVSITNTNTNQPMDTVFSSDTGTQSVAGVSATTTNIIVNVPTTDQLK